MGGGGGHYYRKGTHCLLIPLGEGTKTPGERGRENDVVLVVDQIWGQAQGMHVDWRDAGEKDVRNVDPGFSAFRISSTLGRGFR